MNTAVTGRPTGEGVQAACWSRCFTLIEMLVVMAIIVVLMGLLVPMAGKVRSRGRMTECLSNERQIGLAITMYANDYSDVLPVCARLGRDLRYGLPMLRDKVEVYAGSGAVFRCPADREPECLYREFGTSYEWNTFLSGKQIDRASMRVIGLDVVGPMLGDAEAYHQGQRRNYLYLDGHVSNSLELLIRDR